jgi:tetratricopeptide (TPR) repeat protein
MTILGWWRDWRERRSALSEMTELRDHQEAVLLDQIQNPLNLAKLCVISGDLAEAATQWDRARVLLPNAVLRSPDSLNILYELRRFDEAETLARRRLKLWPGDSLGLTNLARIAEARGDLEEALRRWTIVRRRVKATIDGYIGCATCLTALGRYDEAETQLNRALLYAPNAHGALVALARISDKRKDWPESIARWNRLAEYHKDGPAFGLAAKAMIELGQLDAAEAYLDEPSRVYPSAIDIAVTRSQLAERRGDWTAACSRWESVRSIDPYFHPGYYEGARCLAEANRHGEADRVMAAAIAQFPGQAWPLLNFALLAHNRKDWDEAVTRWSILREKFPEQTDGFVLGANALEAAGRGDEAAALRRGR